MLPEEAGGAFHDIVGCERVGFDALPPPAGIVEAVCRARIDLNGNVAARIAAALHRRLASFR